MKTTTIRLTPTVLESAQLYAAALVQACEESAEDVTPIDYLVDTDEYPDTAAHIDMGEWIVGWFHGVAEAHGVLPEVLWDAVSPQPTTSRSPQVQVTRARTPRGTPQPRRRGGKKSVPVPTAHQKETGDRVAEARAVLQKLRQRRA